MFVRRSDLTDEERKKLDAGYKFSDAEKKTIRERIGENNVIDNDWNPNQNFFADVGRVFEATGAGLSRTLSDLGKGSLLSARNIGIASSISDKLINDFRDENKLEELKTKAKEQGMSTTTLDEYINQAKNTKTSLEHINDFSANTFDKWSNEANQRILELQNETESDFAKNVIGFVPNLSQQAVTIGASLINPMLGTSVATGQAMGSYYNDAKSRGMTDEQANDFSQIMGIVEGGTEMIGVDKLIKAGKGAKALAKSGLKGARKELSKEVITSTFGNLLGGAMDNFIQEAITEPIQEGVADWIGGKGNWENIDQRMLEAGINGAITSLITGGAHIGVQRAVGTASRIKNGEQLTQEQINQDLIDTLAEIEKFSPEEKQEFIDKYVTPGIETAQEVTKQGLDQAQNEPNRAVPMQTSENAQQQVQEQEQQVISNQNENALNQNVEPQNLVESAERSGIDVKDEKTRKNLEVIQKFNENRGIKATFDADAFKGHDNVNSFFRVDENGNREIVFNPNTMTDKTIQQLAVHEIYHDMVAGGSAEELTNFVINKMSQDKEYQDYVKALQDVYEENDSAIIKEEAVAHYLEKNLGTDEFISELQQRGDRTTIQKIIDTIKDMITKAKNTLTGKGDLNYLLDLQRKYEQAYRGEFKGAQEQTKLSKQVNTQDNQGRTLTKEQQEYFKDSKARDENGNLKTFYHKTGSNFNTIDFKKNAQGVFWFTDSKQALESGEVSANGVRPGQDVNIKEFYVDMKNPASWEEYDKYGIEQLKEKGYDGVLLDDDGITTGFVFNNSNQVKDIDNTNPTENADIRYSKEKSDQTDNDGNSLSNGQTQFFENSQARVDSDGQVSENGNLALVYHTMTDMGNQFFNFNPVGTPFYRFGDQAVNYFTDSVDMSGSYASGEYLDADTTRYTSIEQVEQRLNNINLINGTDFRLEKNPKSGMYEIYNQNETKLYNDAKDFYTSLNEQEQEILREANENSFSWSIYRDEISDRNKREIADNVYNKYLKWIESLSNKYNFDSEYGGIQDVELPQRYLSNGLNEEVPFSKDGKQVQYSYSNLEKLFKEAIPNIMGKARYQYGGYVNITNPYIIDAEGENWDSVDSETRENIKRDIEKINKLSQQNKNDIIDKVREYVQDKKEKQEKIKQFDKEVETKIAKQGDLAEYDILKHLVGTDGEISLSQASEWNESTGYVNYEPVLLNKLGVDTDNISSKEARKLLMEDNLEKANEYINEKRYKLNTENGQEEFSLADIKKMQAYLRMQDNRTYSNEFALYLRDNYDIGGEDILTSESLHRAITTKLENDINATNQEIAKDVFDATTFILETKGFKYLSTNDIVKKVIKMNKNGANYDGVIMKNVVDYGGYSETREPANLYVTFNSNQFKAQDNLTPTLDPDMRYDTQGQGKSQEIIDQFLEKTKVNEGTGTAIKDLARVQEETTEPVRQVAPDQAPAQVPQQDVAKERVVEPIRDITDVERPQVPQGNKVRKTYESIINSNQMTQEAKQVARELMGYDTYEPQTNKLTLAVADKNIEQNGVNESLTTLTNKVNNNDKISAVDIAMGERLIQYYSKTGDRAKLQEAIQTTAMAGTEAGRAVQAMAMLNHQTPTGQVTWIQRSIDKVNKRLAKEGKPQFNFTPEMQQKILNSTQENLQKNLDSVYRELGQQVPKSAMEKFNEWRYFSMLANPKTHIRNILGNVVMGYVQRAKNKVAGTIEDFVIGDNAERWNSLKGASKGMYEFAKNDLKNADVQSMLGLNENKYNPQNRLQQNQRTFKNKFLENTLGKAFDLNSKLLEVEDGWGLKSGYAKAMANYLNANKLDYTNLTDTQLQKARQYAVEQAKEATFHQDNSVANMLQTLENKNLFTKIAVGGAIPFKKTPMNVALTGFEYSPAGFVKTLTTDLSNLKKGKISANQFIDNISKNLTGTGIAVVGYALTQAGILKASGSGDEDKDEFEEATGKQNYSIQIGDNTYSLDWLTPAGIPLFIGSELYQVSHKQEDGNKTKNENESLKAVSNILDATASAMNPMSEMTMISGLTNALKSYAQGSTKSIENMLANVGKSYVTQAVPTALGQIARSTDQYERSTTSTEKDPMAKAIDSAKNQIISKIPGLREILPISTDVWGNERETQTYEENAILPWTSKEISKDPVNKALTDLYDATGESGVLPDNYIDKTLTIDKEKYKLTNEEYAELKKQYGKTAHDILSNLTNTNDYKEMTDEQKVKAVKEAYSYAESTLKVTYSDENNLDAEESSTYKKVQSVINNGGDAREYFEYVGLIDGLDKDKEKMKALQDSNIKDKGAIYESTVGKKDETYQIMKNTGIDPDAYLDYKQQEFKTDRENDYSAKNQFYDYMDDADMTYEQKLLLTGMKYKLNPGERDTLANYIESLPISAQEKTDMFSKLKGCKINEYGEIYY